MFGRGKRGALSGVNLWLKIDGVWVQCFFFRTTLHP